MISSTNTPPLGARTHIDVRAIERELSQLWQRIAEGEAGEQGTPSRAPAR